MPDSNEIGNGSSSPEPNPSVSADQSDTGRDSQEFGERSVEIPDFDCPENAPLDLFGSAAADIEDEAEQRAELDGATDDGMSAVYLTGAFRFVTPCHAAARGLRASKICQTCNGDLSKPVETAIPLACGHYFAVNFPYGERRIPCQVCGETSIVRAEQVISTRFIAREMNVAEQLSFERLQGL